MNGDPFLSNHSNRDTDHHNKRKRRRETEPERIYIARNLFVTQIGHKIATNKGDDDDRTGATKCDITHCFDRNVQIIYSITD